MHTDTESDRIELQMYCSRRWERGTKVGTRRGKERKLHTPHYAYLLITPNKRGAPGGPGARKLITGHQGRGAGAPTRYQVSLGVSVPKNTFFFVVCGCVS